VPFVVMDENTGTRIVAFDYENLRAELAGRALVCQSCGCRMIPRQPLTVTPHFYHYRRECQGQYAHHPESFEHLEGKRILGESLPERFPEYAEAVIEYEVIVKEAGRIADVMASFPSGARVAHELQLAAITVADLERRTETYLDAGIDIVWWLGNKADTSQNREWAYEQFGEVLSVSIQSVEVGQVESEALRDPARRQMAGRLGTP
jgi:competence protein CoiA